MFRAATVFGLAASLAGQTAPVSIQRGLAIAEVTLNGEGPFRMLVDTGSGTCSVRPDIAKTLRLEPEYRVTELTPAGERLVPGARSIQVGIGSRTEDRVEFIWSDSSGLSAGGLDVDGILGQSLLSRFDYLLDYRSRQLVIGAPETSGKRVPFASAAGRMLLSAMSPADGAVKLVLDSGASHVLLWRAHALQASSRVGELIATNGRHSASLERIPVLVVGGQALSRLDALVLPRTGAQETEDGLLPARLFRSVYVSNSGGYVKLAQ